MKKVLIFAILITVMISFAAAQDAAEKKLTLKDAIYHALKNNLDLQVQKTNTQLALETLKINQAIFIPQLTLNASHDNSLRPSTNIYEGVATVERINNRLTMNVSQTVPYGGTFTLFFGNSEVDTNSLSARLDPELTAWSGAQFDQPLLKNFGQLPLKYQIYIAKNDLKSSKYQLEDEIIRLVYDVESAYWELVYAHQNKEATKTALQRARDLLKQNEIKVKVGTAAPIEILSSKATVARNESALIAAERTIQTREQALKRILNMSKDPETIVPVDQPVVKDMKVDFDEFLLEALKNRTDIKRAKLDLENYNIRVKYAKNQALPTLDLSLSYYVYGNAGTTWQIPPGLTPFDEGFYREIASETNLWDAWDEAFSMINKNYTVQLSLQIPLGFKREKAQLAQARINMKKSLLQLKNTENTIYSEVREVIKEVESNRKLVDADKIAVELEAENLKAEEKKLSVGISTNFEVLQYQESYAQAQTRALRSVIDYALTLARINRILNRTLHVYNINFSDFYED
jgi:outer membrane protein TolC